MFFFRRTSPHAAQSGKAPFTIEFEMTTGRSRRELPTVRMAVEEYEILEGAGASRIKVTDSVGTPFSKAALRALAHRTPVWDGL